MRKTTVIVAWAAGLAAAVGLPGVAVAQQVRHQADPTAPEAPPQAPPAEEPPSPTEGEAASPEPAPPPEEAPPPSDAAPAPGPLDHTLFPSPSVDSDSLKRQGDERPDARHEGATVSLEDIFAEDWWSHARPIFEFHGYFRTRAQLFYNFSLGRPDEPNQALYPQPSDNQYESISGSMRGATVGPTLCRSSESAGAPNVTTGLRGCEDKTQAGANLRFRLNPELHVSDNLRVMSQIDLLDNVSLGSNPEGYAIGPSSSGGYEVLARNGYLPNGFVDAAQVPPTSGVNGLEDSVRVKRAWAEFTTPLGEARFGRMPNHWGLGMLYNSGDGHDDDVQSTVDRLMVASGIKALDLVIAGMWDFPNEGPLTSPTYPGAETYDRASLDDVNQWGLMLLRSKSPELTKLELARGNLVLNTGIYVNYRTQTLANDQAGNAGANVPGADATSLTTGYSRRGLNMWVPDLWVQLLFRKLRIETEVAAVWGSIESTSLDPNNGGEFAAGSTAAKRYLQQYGFAFELQQKLVEDRLRLNFKTGWASGDADAFDPDSAGNLIPGPGEQQVNDDTISTFRFHPTYRVDSILNRYILQRVQGAYYFNPSLEYDFSRQPNGQRLGGGVNVTWTRASQFVQTPGHAEDLGLELGGSLYFQSKDGGINDQPERMGGFFGQLQYSVLFPLDGLGYQAIPREQLNLDTSAAQMVRMYLGVLF